MLQCKDVPGTAVIGLTNVANPLQTVIRPRPHLFSISGRLSTPIDVPALYDRPHRLRNEIRIAFPFSMPLRVILLVFRRLPF